MNWQHKLRLLIEKSHEEEDLFNIAAIFFPTATSIYINAYFDNLDVELPKDFRELFSITDGVQLAFEYSIFGIEHQNIFGYDLKSCNEDNLLFIQSNCKSHNVKYLIGMTGSGDFLALDSNDSVISVFVHDPTLADFISLSITDFLDNVCLGDKYNLYLHGDEENDFWLRVLKNNKFI
jgi:hypothetical protein